MLFFLSYENERIACNISTALTVKQAKDYVSLKFGLNTSVFKDQQKVLALKFAGSELNDSWIIGDLKILPGSTLKLVLKKASHPSLYVFCRYSRETFSIDNVNWISEMQVSELRKRISEYTGLPVTVSRLVSPSGQEMYDPYRLFDYGIFNGMCVVMETWDGWNDFLRFAVEGQTKSVLSSMSSDEIVAKFQLKVALYISAHFGNVDLASYAMKVGIRSDEPVGEHPSRQWCYEHSNIYCLRAPVHEASYQGQYVLLRMFVSHDICCLLAKDGFGRNALAICLHQKMKQCASFLLTKQWTKVQISKDLALPVILYSKMLVWADRAKNHVLLNLGPEKSSIKLGKKNKGPMVTFGVLVDGYSPSQINSRPIPQNKRYNQRLVRSSLHINNERYHHKPASSKGQRENSSECSMRKLSPKYTKYLPINESRITSPNCKRPEKSPSTLSSDSRNSQTQSIRSESLKLPKIEHGVNKKNAERKGIHPTKELNTDFITSPEPKGSLTPILPKLNIESSQTNNNKFNEFQNGENGGVKNEKKNSKIIPHRTNKANKYRPFFYYPGSRDKIVQETLASYEKYQNMQPLQRAAKALRIAETFKEKPFLLRLKIAMALDEGPIKRLPHIK
ncbi:protein ANKUB1-like [Argonauta hians]